MENLKLKYVAPYLPYGLECHVMGLVEDDYADNPVPILTKLVGLYTDTKKSEYAECSHAEYTDSVFIETDLFPILRPLSEYSKIIDIVDEMSDYHIKVIKDNPDMVKMLPYYIVEEMLENHIDIFGLIPKGLAIDKNTL